MLFILNSKWFSFWDLHKKSSSLSCMFVLTISEWPWYSSEVFNNVCWTAEAAEHEDSNRSNHKCFNILTGIYPHLTPHHFFPLVKSSHTEFGWSCYFCLSVRFCPVLPMLTLRSATWPCCVWEHVHCTARSWPKPTWSFCYRFDINWHSCINKQQIFQTV